MQRNKPSRYHRLDRDLSKFHLEDDTGHLWAVSYADFLMVLLSFFILFFSVNKKDKDTIVNIVAKVKERGLGSGPSLGGRSPDASAAGGVAVSPKAIGEMMKAKLPNVQLEVSEKGKSVTFVLDEDIFDRGSFQLKKGRETQLVEILDLLKPFVPSIDIIFVGHTDHRPIVVPRYAAVENNFDLSALRAAYAVRIAMKAGLPKESLFTHGSADNTRDSKSLSVVVVEKGAGRI